MAKRKAAWKAPPLKATKGTLYKYIKVVESPPRTNWTRRVPHPVLIGHAASLTGQVDARRSRLQWPLRNFPTLVLHNITAVFLEEFREGVGWGVPAHCSSGRSPRAAARGP